ncbi:MAG TPA: DNA translocase FtsK 4TM domain-containing protein, partial [Pyrinomonadaceae bacterium]|nr:DNA translocase FtsK 4TM domain-containing protein [Pyrinomonadaceae bacterium]
MATTQTDVRMRPAGGVSAPRNTRRNEIVAIALFALAALLALCLASYNPDDPSWSSAAEGGARNWVGRAGANVAAALFQSFGLAAILLPLLLLAAAWRRFRTRRIHAPLTRVIGLAALTLAAAALCALYVEDPLVDRSFNAGGVVGVLAAESLKGVLNTVGATVLLAAAAAVGLLLATNFSFVRAYERTAAALANPSGAFRRTVERVNLWREARRAQREASIEMRREARAAREREEEEQRRLAEAAEVAAPIISAKRAAGAEAKGSAASALKRAAVAASNAPEPTSREQEILAQLAQAEAELASIVPQPTVSKPESTAVARASSPSTSDASPAPPAKRTAAARQPAPAADESEVPDV